MTMIRISSSVVVEMISVLLPPASCVSAARA
jgi:hypothetical protein